MRSYECIFPKLRLLTLTNTSLGKYLIKLQYSQAIEIKFNQHTATPIDNLKKVKRKHHNCRDQFDLPSSVQKHCDQINTFDGTLPPFRNSFYSNVSVKSEDMKIFLDIGIQGAFLSVEFYRVNAIQSVIGL